MNPCIFLKLFSSQLKPHIKLDERAIKWIIREKEMEIVKDMAEIEEISTSKSDLQEILGEGDTNA